MKRKHTQTGLFDGNTVEEDSMYVSSQVLYLAEPAFLVSYLEKIENISSADLKSISSLFGVEDNRPDILSIAGDTASIRIEGLLSKSGPSPIDRFFGFGGTSYADIISAVDRISGDENIKKVLLLMNTPGGETSGADETYQAIRSLRAKKHVQAQNHGVIASAGYYLAVAATEIVSTAPSNETGSIGTVAVARDRTKFEQEIGIITVRVISEQSPRKAGIHTKEGLTDIQERVNALTRVFIQRISEGRNVSMETVENDFGRGGLLVAQDPAEDKPDAISTGMIDGLIEGFSDVDSADDVESSAPSKKTSKKIKLLTPASAGQKHTEGYMDTLEQLLAANPSARSEHEAVLKASRGEGATVADTAFQAKVKAIAPFIGNKKYPDKITAFAVDVLSGKQSLEGFQGAVMVFDMNNQSEAQENAEGETEKLKDTPPGSKTESELKDSGEIESNAAFAEAVKRDRELRGLGV